MNISRLNPIGYESKTEQGNKYKKSNLGTSSMIAAFAAIDASGYIWKDNKVAKYLSSEQLLTKDLMQIFKIKPTKNVKTLLSIAGIAIDLSCGVWLGNIIDKKINKKRAEAVDKLALSTAQNTQNN